LLRSRAHFQLVDAARAEEEIRRHRLRAEFPRVTIMIASVRNQRLIAVLVAAVAAALYSNASAAAEKAAAAKKAPSEAQMIASAMRAAPAAVAKDATIFTMDDKGMHTLRKGSNGFSCMPDNPATPGPDPMCMDKNAMGWVDAWVAHKPPPAGKVGLMYMLDGGTDGSNTDPYATKPEANNHWIKTGAHVMIVGADASFYDSYPKSADPDTTQPYVMWAGTPYQHLMAPVR
jgi:hypothetical protein